MDMNSLFQDLKQVSDQPPVIPAGDYNAVVVGWEIDQVQTQDGQTREVLRIALVFQNNPSVVLTDNTTPLDGQSAEYSIFLPDERDKSIPAKYGRGTMYDVSLRKLKRFFKACGVDPAQYPSIEQALDACRDSQVMVRVANGTTEDGLLYDRITAIL